MKRYFDLLNRRPGYRNLWLASVVSLAGDWFNTIASVMIVNRYTETDLAISWILIARTIPRFFLGPLAGVMADRVNRKTIMVISDLLRAGIVLGFLVVDRPERVWLIYVLTTAQFVIASFFEPASSALIPSLIKSNDELLTANVLSSVTWSVMLALGAAAGGFFAGVFGAQAALITDAGTFLVSALLVLRIDYPGLEKSGIPSRGGWQDMVDGFGYVISRPWIGALTLVKTLGQVGSGDIIIAVYAERYFPYGQEGATALGILFAASGLGAVLGPLIGNRFVRGESLKLQRAIQYGYLLIPVGWFFVAWSPFLWVAALGMMIRLMGSSLNWTYSNVLIQSQVPNGFLGRVFALDMGMFTLASSTSIFLTGYFLDTFPLEPRTLVLCFALGNLFPLAIWFYHQLRLAKTDGQLINAAE